jgi:hypothetical protein
MSQPPDNPSDHKLNRWQFSLRGMLIFTVSVAIGAAVARCDMQSWFGVSSYTPNQQIIRMSYGGGLIAILVFWLILGILYQIRDLHASLAFPDLIPQQRWGLRFEIFWRLAVAALIILYAMLSFFIERGAIALPAAEDISWWSDGMMRTSLLVILFFVIIGSVPYKQRKTPNSILHNILYFVACILAILLCLTRWIDYTMIPHLVHIATIGIDWDHSLKLSSINPRSYNFYVSLFFWWSILSSLIVIVNWVILKYLARKWPVGIGRRLILLSFLTIGVFCASVFVIWIKIYGLCKFSPYLAEAGSPAPWHCWIATIMLVIVLTSLVTYRMTAEHCSIADTPQIAWRRNTHKYYHERWWILLLFAIAIIWFHYEIFFAQKKAMNLILTSIGQGSSLSFSLNDLLVEPWLFFPTDYLWLSLFLLSFHRAFSRRPDPQQSQIQLPQINPVKFITIWIATAAVMISGGFVFVWTSFALWFNPWFTGRWP